MNETRNHTSCDLNSDTRGMVQEEVKIKIKSDQVATLELVCNDKQCKIQVRGFDPRSA